MNKIPILLLTLLISGCSSLPPQYAASPTRCLVRGASEGNADVLIRSVDDGAVLWVKGYHLGHEAWLEPGVHKVSVMCSTSTAWGTYSAGTDVEMTIQPGYTYFLTTDPIKDISEKPQVVVTKKANK